MSASCSKCATPVGNVDNLEGNTYVGGGVFGESLCSLLNLTMQLKLL